MVPQRGKTQSPAQTRVKSLKQSIISFPCSHNCCSVFQNPGFKNHTDSYTEQETETELLSSMGSNRTLPPTCPALLGSQGVLPEFCSLHCPRVPREITQLCIQGGWQENSAALYIQRTWRRTEGKQKGHKRRCLKVSSPSILPPPDSELSLLTETVSKRKFQPK